MRMPFVDPCSMLHAACSMLMLHLLSSTFLSCVRDRRLRSGSSSSGRRRSHVAVAQRSQRPVHLDALARQIPHPIKVRAGTSLLFPRIPSPRKVRCERA